jgi:hypothetical protein
MKKLLLLLCSLWAATGSYAQDSLATAAYTMGGGNRENGMLGVKLDNGQSALFNITSNCLTAQCEHGMAGIRIDQNGNMLHYRKFGHVDIDVDPNEAIWTSDKHILLVGQHGDDRILMKIDTMFNVVWSRVIEMRMPGYNIVIESLKELNKTYYLAYEKMLVKVREDGTVVFSKYYGPKQGTLEDHMNINFNTLAQIAPDKFFLGGEIYDDADPFGFDDDAFAAIIDTNGTILKQKKFHVGSTYTNGITYGFKQSENLIRVFGYYNYELYTAELDTNLAVSNVKHYGGTTNMATHSMCFNGTDRYMFTFSHQGMTMLMIDENGDLVWSKSASGGFSPKATYMLNKCTYALYGSCNTGVNNGKKGFWLKVSEDGELSSTTLGTAFTPTESTLTAVVASCNAVDSGVWQTTFQSENFIFDNTAVNDSLWFKKVNMMVCPETPQGIVSVVAHAQKDLCSPNPFYGQMEIGKDWELKKIEHLVVYDITGRVILNEEHPAERTIRFAESVKGMVFVKWMYEGQVYTQKMTGL